MRLEKFIHDETGATQPKVYNIEFLLDKIAGVAAGAQVNQKAFSNVNVGAITIAADNETDTLTIEAGNNITLTPDATNDKITITAKDTVYTHPSYTARTGMPTANATPMFGGAVSITQPVSDGKGHITAMNTRTITIPDDTATTSTAGLMSASDKTKLNDITDYIVAWGTTGIWTYRKWSSGIAECWGVQNYSSIDVSSAWGSVYESDGHKLTFPSGLFRAAPEYCSITYGGGSLAVLSIELLGLPSNSETQTFYLTRATAGTIINVKVQVHAIGRWK